jgi:hypothetical protein
MAEQVTYGEGTDNETTYGCSICLGFVSTSKKEVEDHVKSEHKEVADGSE